MTDQTDKKHYDRVATSYPTVESLPHVVLEHELVTQALGNCTNLKVADLGGGNGVHARRAISLGASHVDLIDISAEMMQIGKTIDAQTQSGQPSKIAWHLADLTKPVQSQIERLQKGSYDIVMANWLFDDCANIADLEAMWTNIDYLLSPTGRVIVTRLADIYSGHIQQGKYGYIASDIVKVEGGIRYKVLAMTDPPFSFPGASVEDSFTGTDQVPGRFGLKLSVMDARQANVVMGDPGYWEDFVERPDAVVCVGGRV